MYTWDVFVLEKAHERKPIGYLNTKDTVLKWLILKQLMARKKGTKNKNIDRCKFSVYCIVKFLEENTMQHECKIIGYTQITNDPEQEVSILYDTKKKMWCIRVWRPDIHGRAVFVSGIEYCPFCGDKLKI